MYKFFSISLTTILMLMNIVGPTQPAMAMDQSSDEPTQVVDQLPGDDGSDVILVEHPVVQDPVVEPDPVDEPQDELTEEDTPEETANSPPVDETVVEDETSSDQAPVADEEIPVDDAAAEDNAAPVGEDEPEQIEEDDAIVIVPNAVDPNPGDCPIGEDCNGGGGSNLISVTFTITEEDGTVIPNANLVVKTGPTGEIVHQTTANQNGQVIMTLDAGTSYFVSAGANRFTTESMTIEPAIGNTQFTFSLSLVPTSTLVVIQLTNNKGENVVGAELVVWNESDYSRPVATGISNSQGKFHIPVLGMGSYQVEIRSHNHYFLRHSFSHMEPVGRTINIPMQKFDDGKATILVLKGWDEPLEGATILITDENGAFVQQGTTGANGKWTSRTFTGGTRLSYTVTKAGFLPELYGGFTVNGDYDNDHFLTPEEVDTASFSVQVKDTMGDPVESARVNIIREPGVVFTGTTDEFGRLTTPSLTVGSYGVSVVASGYTSQVQYIDTTKSQVLEITLLDDSQHSMRVQFVDAETGEPVPFVGFTLESPDDDWYSESADANGFWLSNPMPSGRYFLYTYVDGYPDISIHIDHHNADTVVIGLQQPGKGTLTLHVQDAKTGFAIPNAYVSVVDPGTSKLVQRGFTDDNGDFTSQLLKDQEYLFVVSADDFGLGTMSLTVGKGESTYLVRMSRVVDMGSLEFNVHNPLGNPVRNARVTVFYEGAIVDQGYTDDDGSWYSHELPSDKYTWQVRRTSYFVETGSVDMNNGDIYVDVVFMPLEHEFWRIAISSSVIRGQGTLVNPALGSGLVTNSVLAQVPADQQPVTGVNARLIDPLTFDVVAETVSDNEGYLTFSEISPGSYILEVDGFMSTPIELGDNQELDLVLIPIDNDDDDTPTNPEPGDGDDDDTPTNPEPGDGDDDDTPTNPETGDGDDDTPTNPEPGDGDDDTPTNPEPGDGDNGTTPGGESDDSANDDADDESASSESASEVAQSAGGSDSTRSSEVSGLPNSGVGPETHTGAFALTLAAVFLLLSALGVRKSRR